MAEPVSGDELLCRRRFLPDQRNPRCDGARLPHHPDLGHPHETGLIVWAS
jgi:hypothetical protein